MNQKIKALLLIVGIAAFLTVAVIAYEQLSKNYTPPTDVPQKETGKEDAESGSENKNAVYAPDFTVYDGEGKEAKLSDMKEKPVVINFWATWCSPCKMEMPHFDAAFKEYKNDVHFMMVNLTCWERQGMDAINEFISDGGYSFPVYYDKNASTVYTYGINSIPMTVFVNSDGTVYTALAGALSESMLKNYMDGFLEYNK